jgi:broad specificity phosphatase PhoE
MTEVTLVRHGQANAAARDPDSYDYLSDLGHDQARWLGEYISPLGHYDRVVSGTLRRQLGTAEGANQTKLPHDTDARLNELDYYGLAHSLRDSHGIPFPDSPEGFAAHVPHVLDVWRSGGMSPDLESYEAFRSRIMDSLSEITRDGPGALIVTSTGVIATLTAIALGLDTSAKTKMFLTVAHTSIHKFELRRDGVYLTQYGATPHLDTPDRAFARTFV